MADGHEQGGSALAPWQSGSGSFPIGGTCDSNGNNCEYIGYVLGPSIDRAIGDRLVTDYGLQQRHLSFRVGDQNNDIWNTHSHAGPEGTQAPIPPETSPFSAYTRLFSNVDLAGQQNLAKRLAMKQSALDLLNGELTPPAEPGGRVGQGAARPARPVAARHRAPAAEHRRRAPGLRGAQPRLAPSTSSPPTTTWRWASCSSRSSPCRSPATWCAPRAFNWSGNTSDRVYTALGMTEGHHTISHLSDTTSFDKIRTIKKYLFQQSTLLHDELKALPEAGGTVWDRTMVMHWSELSQGDTHQKDQDLVVLASGDNYFRMGRMLDLTNKPQRALSNLLISLWQYMGYTDVTSWGDPLLMPDGPGPMPNLV